MAIYTSRGLGLQSQPVSFLNPRRHDPKPRRRIQTLATITFQALSILAQPHSLLQPMPRRELGRTRSSPRFGKPKNIPVFCRVSGDELSGVAAWITQLSLERVWSGFG